MPLFMCDGCWEEIPVLKARIHCQECADFDLCANCFVVGRFGGSHSKKHKTVLEERSGIDTSEENGGQVVGQTLGKTDTQVMWPINATSPPYSSTQSPISTQSRAPIHSPARSSQHSTPALTPMTFAPAVTGYQQSFSGVQNPLVTGDIGYGWQPLFQGTQPTQTMVDLLTAIFLCLDVAGTRLLTPEQYSAFLDAQGYVVEENIWKRNFKPQYGYNPDDIADFELRTAYENFAIDHVLHVRSTSLGVTGQYNPSLSPISNALMPMLSLRGFIDITTVEVLGEPSVGWQRLNSVKKFYGVWLDWGDIPRAMVPEVAPPELLERIARISEFAQRRAEDRAEARRTGSGSGVFPSQNMQLQLDSYGRQINPR